MNGYEHWRDCMSVSLYVFVLLCTSDDQAPILQKSNNQSNCYKSSVFALYCADFIKLGVS